MISCGEVTVVDLIIACIAGGIATFSLQYLWGVTGNAGLVLGTAVSFVVWFSFRLNKA